MYDPTISRILSPDNFVQDETNAQNYNRYSYVINNPLKWTDPSGWLIDKYFDELGNYLGDDNVGNNIRIMTKDRWDMWANDVSDLSSIECELKQASTLFSDFVRNSKENIMDLENMQLNIYQHFNPTDLRLENKKGEFNMAFDLTKDSQLKLLVNLEQNKQYSNNFYNIINKFIHEEKHYNDYQKIG